MCLIGVIANAATFRTMRRPIRMSNLLTHPTTDARPRLQCVAVAAAMLGISPDANVPVVAQQLGVSTSVQLFQQNGSAYQLSDLTIDLSQTGTPDPLTGWHNGNPSWYVGDSTDVTHVVNILTPPRLGTPAALSRSAYSSMSMRTR